MPEHAPVNADADPPLCASFGEPITLVLGV